MQLHAKINCHYRAYILYRSVTPTSQRHLARKRMPLPILPYKRPFFTMTLQQSEIEVRYVLGRRHGTPRSAASVAALPRLRHSCALPVLPGCIPRAAFSCLSIACFVATWLRLLLQSPASLASTQTCAVLCQQAGCSPCPGASCYAACAQTHAQKPFYYPLSGCRHKMTRGRAEDACNQKSVC